MSLRLISWGLTIPAVLLAATWLSAQEPQQDPSTLVQEPKQVDSVSDQQMADLIKQLDANRFSHRQDASRQLRELGVRAIKPLTEAALGESREAAGRAFEILKSHYSAPDGALKEAAKAALQKLATSDKAIVARKAQEVLDPKPAAPAPPAMNPFGGQIQIRFQQGGAQNIQVQNNNGVKDISVQENGRSIKIHDDPNKGITVEITEKVNGKDVKKKYEAKDVAELKKKHPEAHREYEKYSKGAQIQIQAPIAIQGIRVAPVLPGFQPPGNAKELAKQLEKISAQVDEARKLLEQLKENPQQTESLQKAIDQLEEGAKH